MLRLQNTQILCPWSVSNWQKFSYFYISCCAMVQEGERKTKIVGQSVLCLRENTNVKQPHAGGDGQEDLQSKDCFPFFPLPFLFWASLKGGENQWTKHCCDKSRAQTGKDNRMFSKYDLYVQLKHQQQGFIWWTHKATGHKILFSKILRPQFFSIRSL